MSKPIKLNYTHMKTLFNFRVLITLSLFLLTPVFVQAQADKTATELKKLEPGFAAAKAKVALNERKVTVADSLIESGNQLVAESKTETKTIDAERKKLDKDFAAKQKPLTKLSTSKDKGESSKARADLKALNVQYRSDAKALDNRLKDATKKLTKGNSNLTKGKAAKKSAQDALKVSQANLKTVQAKYDAAYFSGGNTNPNNKIIK
jgi:chromosome segregation ATPase